jgi:hypothetical protein
MLQKKVKKLLKKEKLLKKSSPKTIYLDILGPEQTQDMIYAFAEGLENHEYKQVTIH